MYLIALCDDEEADLDKAESMLKNYQNQHPKQELVIERFSCVEELLYMVREESFVPDLIFMDIYMPEKQGMEAAKELRKMGNECQIIFLTAAREFALDAFGVNAIQYLLKPVSSDKLFPVLDKVLSDLDEERKKYLLLRSEGRIHRVPINNIVYCEAQRKHQCVYLSDGSQLLLRMTLGGIYDMLSEYPEFIKAGIAYIVNLNHIDSLNAQSMQMDNGMKVFLPRGTYKPLKEQYFEYYCDENR